MKILHIGFEVPALSKALQNACDEYSYMDWTSWTAIPNNTDNLHNETIKRATEFNPDLTFMHIQSSGVYDAETISKIPGKVVNWTWDVRVPTPQWFIDVAPFVISGFTNGYDVDNLRGLGHRAEFIQSGFDDETFTPDGSTGEYEKIVFIGNNYPQDDYSFPLANYRIETVNRLSAKYGQDFGVYGFGWANPMKNFMYRERKEAECYRSCKIAINLSHYELRRYSSDRILRLMGGGAFCLSKWYPGIEEDFTDGVHLRTWKTHEELEELIEYYLSHDEERTKIAKSGCDLVRSQFTWTKMIERIKACI